MGEARLHDPSAAEPEDCSACVMDRSVRMLGGMNRSCCQAQINAYHDADCPHAGWNPPELHWPPFADMSAALPMPNTHYRVAEAANERAEAFWAEARARHAAGQRPLTLLEVRGRQAGKNTSYEAAQRRLADYYAPEQIKTMLGATGYYAVPDRRNVDATFENEFTMNGGR